MTDLEHIKLLHKRALPGNIGIRDGSTLVCWRPTGI